MSFEVLRSAQRRLSLKQEIVEERAAAQKHLAHVAEHHSMTAEQRRTLVMALGVLAMLENGES